jgi:hypothetical protein
MGHFFDRLNPKLGFLFDVRHWLISAGNPHVRSRVMKMFSTTAVTRPLLTALATGGGIA